jgi:hypothetical protein
MRGVRAGAKVVAAAVTAYGVLVVADVVHQVRWRRATERLAEARVRGLYETHPVLGYRPRPGFVGAFPAGTEGDEGRPRRVEINELAHRESASGPVDTLLVGDSFVFGVLLDQGETIAAQASRISGRRFYGAGASGYDMRQVTETLRAALPALSPRHVVYVFCENDLWHRPNRRFEVRDGHLFELTAGGWRGAGAFQPPPMSGSSSWRLEGLRGLRVAKMIAPSMGPEDVAASVRGTLEMQALASASGASFSVFVLPNVADAVRGERFEAVLSYDASLRLAGVSVASCDLQRSDFFPGDQHVNARGAEKIALALAGGR